MSKTTLLTLVFILGVLAASFFVMRSFGGASQSAAGGSGPEARWLEEAIQCTAYYELSAQTLSGMNVPQMAAVAGRLETSATQARALAQSKAEAEVIDQRVKAAFSEMRASMPNAQSLGPLMGQYKGPCQSLLTAPDARLAYWQQQAG
ncbi:hypothetical protein [Ferrimonas balearica]|uniref:hypothetical protein n=1 Tax=Ferrimonas balearica TaxID=44012 RepID=UPI001C9936BA|nr:hypothetical protein [Ferrimonas balearica]MBY5991384.1 hypothetical protein [Ferrimonas balearica]